MDDLISRSALLKILEEEHDGTRRIYSSLSDYVDKAICKGERGAYARVKRIVEETPAVDAVEVVRCKDCKHYRANCCFNSQWDMETAREVPLVRADDFCSYGERREENAAD